MSGGGVLDWFAGGPRAVEETQVLVVAARLGVAAILGAIVASVHRRTGVEDSALSFRVTLVLLTILIAAVTQVIGDNVARAFSLVGALSIVRFRTIVRDTRDTVYVIFSVTVGMAAGAGDVGVALVALAVVSLAAAVLHLLHRRGARVESGESRPWRLTVRVTLGKRAEEIVASAFARHLDRSAIARVASVKGGAAIESAYDVWLRPGADPAALVDELNAAEGVQATEIEARPVSPDET